MLRHYETCENQRFLGRLNHLHKTGKHCVLLRTNSVIRSIKYHLVKKFGHPAEKLTSRKTRLSGFCLFLITLRTQKNLLS